jgi:hypothetical protein
VDGGALLPFWGVVRRVFGRLGHASRLRDTKSCGLRFEFKSAKDSVEASIQCTERATRLL